MLLKKSGVLFVLVLIGFIVCSYKTSQEEASIIMPEDAALKATINQCEGVAERAVAHLVAVVEFQKLEIAGRKARVFKLCQQDHGYVESKGWLTYSTKVAEKLAKETKISESEALESLRRTDMLVAAGEHGRPPYWQKGQKPKPN